MHIAYIRQEPGKKPKKLTYKEEVKQLADRLLFKWKARDRANAESDLAKIEQAL